MSENIHPGSKMSFTGAARWVAGLGWRQTAGVMWHRALDRDARGWAQAGWLAGAVLAAVVLISADWLLLAAAWAAVACWYVLIFGLFGVLVVPWRVVMRGRRRADARQRVLLDEVRALRAGR